NNVNRRHLGRQNVDVPPRHRGPSRTEGEVTSIPDESACEATEPGRCRLGGGRATIRFATTPGRSNGDEEHRHLPPMLGVTYVRSGWVCSGWAGWEWLSDRAAGQTL